jgi:hypothetical protein
MNEQIELETLITIEERLAMPTVEYGENIKVNVVDFKPYVKQLIDKRKEKGMAMVVEIKAIKIDKNKELSDTVSWSKDHKTGIYYGIPFGLHQDGNVKWRKILLQEYNSFNLMNPDEAKQLVCLLMHPHIEGSPFQRADPIFFVYDADVEASKDANKAMVISNAIQKAFKMKKTEILSFHRYLALPLPPDVTPKRVKNDITKFAMDSPEEFMAKYDNPGRVLAELFHSGKALGAIIFNAETGFTYRGTFLGHTDIECLRFLEEDTITLSSLRERITELDVDQKEFVNTK